MMYHAYQTQTDAMWPLRAFSRVAQHHAPQKRLAAACGVLNLAEVTHSRPPNR